MTNFDYFSDRRKLGLKAELQKLSGTHTIKVDPRLANSWLLLNQNNRPLSESHVQEYVARMKNGEWVLNGQCIIFSNTGVLLDGQHRLAAVVNSGLTIPFDVRFGINEETFATIDDGKKRTPADVFSIESIPNYANAAAVVNLVIGMERGATNDTMHSASRPSNIEMAKWYFDHQEIADFVLFGIKWYDASGRLLTPSKFASYAYMMAKVDEAAAMKFMEQLAFGFNLTTSSPVFKLRSMLAKAKVDKTKKLSVSYERALIIKAWNFFRKGKTVKILKYDTEREDFPKFD